MLRISNLSLPLEYDEATLLDLAAQRLGVPQTDILQTALVKRSIDARDKGDVHFVCSLDVKVVNQEGILQKKRSNVTLAKDVLPPPAKKAAFRVRPVVIGAGPAGLFAALTLCKAGAKPILIERGKPVGERTKDVAKLFQEGVLNPQSNVQFGEGGAGAFSDGKLTTGIKNPYQKTVLDTFIQHGAPEEIGYLAKPHIGTDRLKAAITSMRQEILSMGGEVWFESTLTGLELKGDRLIAIQVKKGEETTVLPCETMILAIGHSARDTYQSLFTQGLTMTQKPFAIGVRIEHPQAMINKSQYGPFAGHAALGAADYKLNVHTPDGRGVYTFCMCPGGQVVAAASQADGVVTNGMSAHARDGANANAALLVGIRPEDFQDEHPLAGLVFQRQLEQAAYKAGGGDYKAPCQRVEDFMKNRESRTLGSLITPSYRPGVTPGDLRACLPDYVLQNMRLGINGMDRQLRGFAHPDARGRNPLLLPCAHSPQ